MDLRAATRASPLARVQTGLVAYLLNRNAEESAGADGASSGLDGDMAPAGADAERAVRVWPVVVDTAGDRDRDTPIAGLGGQGVFVKEVQAAVLDGRADFAVHSAKDLPSGSTPGLVLAAVPLRGDPRDGLVGSKLADLAPGAHVGTGSVRRRAQLAGLRPDLRFGELRGNMERRLARSADFDAVVVAVAALQRLGRQGRLAEALEPEVMLPQVGQGALAVECRADDVAMIEALAAIEDPASRTAVDAERAFLAEVGGGCDQPVAAYARVSADGSVRLEAMLASVDGTTILRHDDWGDDPVALGQALARHLLAAGGAALLQQ